MPNNVRSNRKQQPPQPANSSEGSRDKFTKVVESRLRHGAVICFVKTTASIQVSIGGKENGLQLGIEEEGRSFDIGFHFVIGGSNLMKPK